MAKYDVYSLGAESVSGGYVVDVQTDLLHHIDTRMVVPLVAKKTYRVSASRLNPVFAINETDYVLLTQSMSSVPTKILNQPVANLSAHFDEITNALDMLFQGF